MKDLLDKNEIERLTGGNFEVLVYDVIDSTNTEAKRILKNYPGRNLILTSDMQQGGRGRQGKSFASPRGNIYMTVVLHPGKAFPEVVGLTTFSAICLSEAIEEVLGLEPKIKWINDVYVNGRKVSGILCEAVAGADGSIDSIVVGIGVNVYPFDVPEEIKSIVGFLNSSKPCRNEIISRTANKLLTYDFSNPDFLKTVIYKAKSRSCVIGKPVKFYIDNKEYTGFAEAIDDDGALIVNTSEGKKYLRSGEVTLRVDC